MGAILDCCPDPSRRRGGVAGTAWSVMAAASAARRSPRASRLGHRRPRPRMRIRSLSLSVAAGVCSRCCSRSRRSASCCPDCWSS